MRSLQARVGLGFLLALSLLGGPVLALAQGLGGAPDEGVPGSRSRGPRTYGTTTLTSYTLGAFAFTAGSGASSPNFNSNANASRFCTAMPCVFEAPVQLPAGALVTRIELDACDTNAAASVTAQLYRNPDLEAGIVQLVVVSTGLVATPGCAFFFADLSVPETIDNFNNVYIVQVAPGATDSTTRFWAVRLYYMLQMSPAPATASFTDVPTSNMFFPAIEALHAAGITGGCSVSPPKYCPDDFITRAQVAQLLGKALGLHFAP